MAVLGFSLGGTWGPEISLGAAPSARHGTAPAGRFESDQIRSRFLGQIGSSYTEQTRNFSSLRPIHIVASYTNVNRFF